MKPLRGKGVGQSFFKKIQIWAKQQGYEELELSSSFLEHKPMNFISKKWILKNLALFLRKISNYNIF